MHGRIKVPHCREAMLRDESWKHDSGPTIHVGKLGQTHSRILTAQPQPILDVTQSATANTSTLLVPNSNS